MKVLKTIGFWFIQCTWGFIMTLIGAITVGILMLMGNKPQHIGPNIYIQTGYGWGGINLGPFFICSKSSGDETKYHECGHGLQNMIWGPLFPFVIGFPSLIRCWIRNRTTHLGKSLFNLAYFLISIVVTTAGAILFGPVIDGFKWLTIVFEVLRLYFLLVSIWLSALEIPKYDHGYIDYDSIWFEGQATRLGIKVYKK